MKRKSRSAAENRAARLEFRRATAVPWQRLPKWLSRAAFVCIPLAFAANVLALAFVVRQFRAVASSGRRAARAPDDTRSGVGVFHGRTVGPDDRRSLVTGRRTSIQFGWLRETTGSGKNRTTRTVCEFPTLSDAVLETAAGMLHLDLHDEMQVVGRTDPDPMSIAPTIDLGEPAHTRAVPAVVSQHCRRTRGTHEYYEVSLGQRAVVSVSLCRQGDRLRPCNRPGDYLSPGGFRRVSRLWTLSALGPVRIAFTLSGLLALAGAFVAWRRQLDVSPARRPARMHE